jgi:hypothetical protein
MLPSMNGTFQQNRFRGKSDQWQSQGDGALQYDLLSYIIFGDFLWRKHATFTNKIIFMFLDEV